MQEDDDLDFGALLIASVRRVWVLLLCTLITGSVGTLVIYKSKPEYTARMVFQPSPWNQRKKSIGLGGIQSSLFANKTDDRIAQYLSTLGSIELINSLMSKGGAEALIFPKLWDAEHQTWYRATGTIADFKRDFKSWFNRETDIDLSAPYIMSAALETRITLTPYNRKMAPNVYTIQATGPTPENALALLNAVHREAEHIIQKKNRLMVENVLLGVRKRVSETTEADLRRQLLTQQISLEVEAISLKDQHNSLFMLLDPPAIASPPKIIPLTKGLVTSLIAGIVLGMFLNVLSFFRRLRKKPSPETPSPYSAVDTADSNDS